MSSTQRVRPPSRPRPAHPARLAAALRRGRRLLRPRGHRGPAAVPCLGVRPGPSARACRARTACREPRCATHTRDPLSRMATWETAIKPYKSPVKKGTNPMWGRPGEGPCPRRKARLAGVSRARCASRPVGDVAGVRHPARSALGHPPLQGWTRFPIQAAGPHWALLPPG